MKLFTSELKLIEVWDDLPQIVTDSAVSQ